MKQPDLLFPSFFWRFIITEKLKIDDIYEIDKSYKDVTTNLLLSANNMTDEEFENLMSLTTIFDLRGNPVRIDLGNNNSSSIRISKSNCVRFVAICNDYRLNELIYPLLKIKESFWQNLAIEPPPFVTPSLLELMACGNRTITVDDLRVVTRFNGVDDTQRNFFWQTVTRMSNDERKKLIHFSTGLNSLNSRGLSIDNLGNQYLDHLPTASTCFFSIHLPPYSISGKMYNAFIIAINETGTFENA